MAIAYIFGCSMLYSKYVQMPAQMYLVTFVHIFLIVHKNEKHFLYWVSVAALWRTEFGSDAGSVKVKDSKVLRDSFVWNFHSSWLLGLGQCVDVICTGHQLHTTAYNHILTSHSQPL